MTAEILTLVVEAVAGDPPYLLSSGGSVGELNESLTADGERVLAVGGGHGIETD